MMRVLAYFLASIALAAQVVAGVVPVEGMCLGCVSTRAADFAVEESDSCCSAAAEEDRSVGCGDQRVCGCGRDGAGEGCTGCLCLRVSSPERSTVRQATARAEEAGPAVAIDQTLPAEPVWPWANVGRVLHPRATESPPGQLAILKTTRLIL